MNNSRNFRRERRVLIKAICFIGICLSEGLFAQVKAANSKPLNGEEFSTLCWFLKLSEEAYKLNNATFFANLIDWGAVSKIVRNLTKIQEALNTTEMPLGLDLPSHSVKISDPKSLHAAKAIVDSSLRRLREIETVMEGLRQQASSDLGAAKTSAAEAITGSEEDAKNFEAIDAKLQTVYLASSGANRDKACKGSTERNGKCIGKEQVAGCSLSNDILCLCVTGKGSGQADKTNLCGIKVTVANFWGQDKFTNGPSADWKILYDHCNQKLVHEKEVSPQTILRALERFDRLLGRQAHDNDGSKKLTWVLGEMQTEINEANVCKAAAGGSYDYGQCVDYGNTEHTARSTIVWYDKFRTAQAKMNEVDASIRKARRLEAKAESILLATELTLSGFGNLDEQLGREGASKKAGIVPHNGMNDSSKGRQGSSLAAHGAESLAKAERQSWLLLAVVLL